MTTPPRAAGTIRIDRPGGRTYGSPRGRPPPGRPAARARPRGRGTERMGRRAVWVIAACWLAATGLLPGCAAGPSRADRAAASPETLRLRRELSHAAQSALDRGDTPAARQALERLVALEPRSAEVHQRLGGVWQAEGRLDLAESAYRRALELDPEYPAALIGLGRVEARLGRLTAALGHLDAAVELDPARAEAHRARAEVLEGLGRLDDALAAHFRVLEYDPTSAATMRRVAALQLARDRPEQALARLDLVLELTPDDPEARHLRGRARLATGRPGPAVDDLRFAASRLPHRPDVFFDLALALRSTQPDAALAAAERAAALAPAWADARELAATLRR